MKRFFLSLICWLRWSHPLVMRWDENPGLRCKTCGKRPPKE